MNYQVWVLVNNEWELAKETSTISQAKGFEAQCKLGGMKTKVVKKPRD